MCMNFIIFPYYKLPPLNLPNPLNFCRTLSQFEKDSLKLIYLLIGITNQQEVLHIIYLF